MHDMTFTEYVSHRITLYTRVHVIGASA